MRLFVMVGTMRRDQAAYHQANNVLGLGGTSLMNANVYLEADEETLQMEAWPQEIRDHPGCLDDCKFPFFVTILGSLFFKDKNLGTAKKLALTREKES